MGLRLIVLGLAIFGGLQTALGEQAVCGLEHPGECLKDIARDQAGIVRSPFRAKRKDGYWILPFAAATGLALHYDMQAQRALGMNKSRTDISNKIAPFASPYAILGGAGALYLVGFGMHNEHLAESGRLGAEAVADASLVAVALKLATNRQRLDTGNGQGGFWPHGTNSFEVNSSFPSGHATASWALARVIASEYHCKPIQIAAYAFATAVSVSRVTGRDHFPSDVLVGSVLGYLIGGYVTRHHASEPPAP